MTRGGEQSPPPPQIKEKRSCSPSRRNRSRRRNNPRGWARTGLEPETTVLLNCIPYEAIIDIGSPLSMIDVELCENLCLSVNPFTHDISHYEGIEGVKMVGSALSILEWVEVELSILHMGSRQAKFWITECMYDRATPIVLGSHQVKKIFAQANLDRIDQWPKPRKQCMNGVH